MLNPFRLYVYHILAFCMPETRLFKLKCWLLAWCGVEIKSNVCICSSAKILGSGILRIDSNVWIGPLTCVISASNSRIHIESNVDIGPRCLITTGTHKIGDSNRRAGISTAMSIEIAHGTWIGAGSVVLPGANIPSSSVFAAGSVITIQQYESNTLYAGVPALRKRSL